VSSSTGLSREKKNRGKASLTRTKKIRLSYVRCEKVSRGTIESIENVGGGKKGDGKMETGKRGKGKKKFKAKLLRLKRETRESVVETSDLEESIENWGGVKKGRVCI